MCLVVNLFEFAVIETGCVALICKLMFYLICDILDHIFFKILSFFPLFFSILSSRTSIMYILVWLMFSCRSLILCLFLLIFFILVLKLDNLNWLILLGQFKYWVHVVIFFFQFQLFHFSTPKIPLDYFLIISISLWIFYLVDIFFTLNSLDTTSLTSLNILIIICCCWVSKLYPTVCNSMDYSTPGFPVLHYLWEFAQIHVHSVGDAV